MTRPVPPPSPSSDSDADQALRVQLVDTLRRVGGVKAARRKLRQSRGEFACLHGLPAPLALMLAGQSGGWMEQPLLNAFGQPRDGSATTQHQAVAKRHLALLRWAAQWPDPAAARAMLALGWLLADDRTRRSGRPAPRNFFDAQLAWSDTLGPIQDLAAQHGLKTTAALLATAIKQVQPAPECIGQGPPHARERWGPHASVVALLCARTAPVGLLEIGQRLWLESLAVLHRTRAGWSGEPVAPGQRRMSNDTLAALTARLAHGNSRQAPEDPGQWVDVLGAQATTDALVACWVVVCQPTNPVVPLPAVSMEGLPEQWARALARHVQAHPSQAPRVHAVAQEIAWPQEPAWPGMEACLRQVALSAALDPASTSRPAPRL